MAKNEKKATGRTMEQVLVEVKKNISDFNATSEPVTRNSLEVALKALINEYNEMSLLTAYAGFKAEDKPLVAMATAYQYATIASKDVSHTEMVDGVKKTIWSRVLDTERTKMLNVTKFIEWMNERNVDVAAKSDWRKALNDARAELIAQWKSFIEDGVDFKVGAMKKALQGMVDALVYLEGENGSNAYIVSSKLTRSVIAFCTARKDGLKGTIAARNAWERIQMDVLHAVVTKKEYAIVYGDPEPEEEETSEEESAEQ